MGLMFIFIVCLMLICLKVTKRVNEIFETLKMLKFLVIKLKFNKNLSVKITIFKFNQQFQALFLFKDKIICTKNG